MDYTNLVVGTIILICTGFMAYLFYKIISDEAEHRGWLKGYKETSEIYSREIEKLKKTYDKCMKDLGEQHINDIKNIMSNTKALDRKNMN